MQRPAALSDEAQGFESVGCGAVAAAHEGGWGEAHAFNVCGAGGNRHWCSGSCG